VLRGVRHLVAVLVVIALCPLMMGLLLQRSTGDLECSSYLNIMNPEYVPADATIEYIKEQEMLREGLTLVADAGRLTVVRELAGAFDSWDATTIVTSDTPLVVGRPLIWQDPRGGTQLAACSAGATTTSKTWYLGEGKTSDGFTTSINVLNPGETPADVNVTYITQEGAKTGAALVAPPMGAATWDAADTVSDTSSFSAVVTADVPIVAGMLLTWAGGLSSYASVGVSAVATRWYLAEGNTGAWSGFETSVVVANPGKDVATVTVDCITDGALHAGPKLTVPPLCQTKVDLADSFPDHPQLTAVVSSDTPVVAMQTMTWSDGQGINPTMGAPRASDQWYFPAGTPTPEFSTWIAVQNVGDETAKVTVDLVTEAGIIPGPTFDVDPLGRHSLSIEDLDVDLVDFTIAITAQPPVLAQQGTYWQCGDLVHRDVNFGSPSMSDEWYLPTYPGYPMGP